MWSLNGEPISIPSDWVTVSVTHEELTEEFESRHGQQNMDHVLLHMLRERGVRVIMPTDTLSSLAGPPIEQPSYMISDHEGITVHQGPRRNTC